MVPGWGLTNRDLNQQQSGKSVVSKWIQLQETILSSVLGDCNVWNIEIRGIDPKKRAFQVLRVFLKSRPNYNLGTALTN